MTYGQQQTCETQILLLVGEQRACKSTKVCHIGCTILENTECGVYRSFHEL
jgi:hypothetical protein